MLDGVVKKHRQNQIFILKGNNMKNIVFAMLLAFGASQAYATDSPKKETRQVCVDVTKDGKPVTDPKTGKVKQKCMNVKVHKKLDNAKAVPGK